MSKTRRAPTPGRLVLATFNRHKISEMKEIFAPLDLELRSLMDYAELGEVKEDGTSFSVNAVKKAAHAALATGEVALADDSGLEVAALNGRPGVRSARYAPTNNERLARVLHELREVPHLSDRNACVDRRARFVCVMALADPRGYAVTREGICEGWITHYLLGSGGFGYDPIFFVPELGQTMAQLTAAAKNRISHRGRAARAMAPVIKEVVCRGKDLREFEDFQYSPIERDNSDSAGPPPGGHIEPRR